jgi:hypothetical protein
MFLIGHPLSVIGLGKEAILVEQVGSISIYLPNIMNVLALTRQCFFHMVAKCLKQSALFAGNGYMVMAIVCWS